MKDFWEKIFRANQSCQACPSLHEIQDFLERMVGFLYKEFSGIQFNSLQQVQEYSNQLSLVLTYLLENTPSALAQEKIAGVVQGFFQDDLAKIYDQSQADLQAIYDGDPAAKSKAEVVRSYPGFYAVLVYRIAHFLHQREVKIIPRILTETAHSKTGIDIHPGATIGSHFCIDHGTGVVIGETCQIGNHVKIYQGVTLGALSVNKEDGDKKRHPTIEDNVVIYANATILGGKTTIGKGSVIGGNTWITSSVKNGSVIYYQAFKDGDGIQSDINNIKI